MQIKRPIVIGIFSGITVFLFGFATMYLMWRMIGSYQGLPGFFFYRAATIGDGICLPILIGTCVTFNLYNREKLHAQSRHKKISCVVALVVSVTAILVQASWLIRDDTALNWSIPIQHHFNVAGWYHSLFFIAMFGILAYQMCEMWFAIYRKETSFSWFERSLFILFTFSGTLFVLMFSSDDYSQYISPAILLTIVAVGMFLVLALYVITANRKHGDELLPEALMGMIASYSVSILICVPARGDFGLALGGALCACFLWRVDKFTVGQLIYWDCWVIMFYTPALYVVSGMNDNTETFCALLLLIGTAFLCEKLYIKEMRFRSASLLIVGIYAWFINVLFGSEFFDNEFFAQIEKIDDVMNLLFIIAIHLLFKKEIRNYFIVLTEAEKQQNKSEINKKQFFQTKAKVYLQIVLGILAVTVLIARWFSIIAKLNGNEIGMGVLIIPREIRNMLYICVLVLFLLGSKKLRSFILVKIGAVIISILVFVALIGVVMKNIEEIPTFTWTPLKWVMLVCSICACIGASILSAHGYYMNIVWLRGLSKKKSAFFLAIIQLIGGMVLNFSVTVLILCHQTWKVLLLIVVVTVTAFELLPILSARIIQYEHQLCHVVKNNVLGGIAQDGMMICLVVFFASCMPCMYISLINVIDILAIACGCGLIAMAFYPVGFCISNNVEHIERQRKVLEEHPEEKNMWDILRKCLVCQSKQTVFAMLPYVCLVVAGMIVKGFAQSKTFTEVVKEIMCKYIDKEDCKESK